MKRNLPSHLGILSITIIVIALFAMSVIWPMGAFPVNQSSTAVLDDYRESNPSNETDFIRQEFSPMYEELQSVSVYLTNDPESIDTMKCVFRLYDYTGTCLLEHFFQLEEMELPGYVKVPVNMELSPGTLYYYTIGGVDGDIYAAYCSDEHKTAENGAMYYKEVPAGGTSLATEYEYKRPMGLKRILVGYLGIAILSAVILYVINLFREKAKNWETVETWFKRILYGLTAMGVLVSFWGIVIKQLFTHSALNITVLFLGVVIAAVALVFGIYVCKGANTPLEEGEKTLKEKGVGIVRALLLGGTILFICLHNNAMTDYEKGLYLRDMLACFGVFLVSYSKKKEIWNISNLIWTIVAFIGGKYYVSLHSDHIEHINTAIRSAYLMWSMGLVVINLIYMGIHGKFKNIKKINIPYAIVVYLFWIACIIFSNGRKWPLLLLIVFTLWGIKYFMQEDKEAVLEDVCNGILLAFIGGVIFCLYRRPYQYSMLTRYGGIYYTATSTALYLCVPLCASLIKARKRNKWPGLVLFGIAFAYMLFTASRTGIIAMSVAVLFLIFFPNRSRTRDWILKRIQQVSLLLLSVIAGFVTTFSATRIIPSIIRNPFYFFNEKDVAYINEDTPCDAVAYITVERSLELLCGRLIIQKTEGTNSSYKPSVLLASSDEITEGMIEEGKKSDIQEYSNGRMEIFKYYMNNLNIFGHNSMSLTLDNGEELMHAHNTYIQTAYDFGVFVGVFFLIVCLYTFIRAMKVIYEQGDKNENVWLLLVATVAFGVASLFEWTYYLCIPLGFLFLLVMVSLMERDKYI